MNDSTFNGSSTPGDPSRRRFITTTAATTAGAAVAPLFVTNVAQAAVQPVAPAPVGGMPPSDKAQDLARETTLDAGQAITTDQGAKISDNQNSLKAGVRGPTLIEDHVFREKMTRFDHERIPERVVHARGAAAHG